MRRFVRTGRAILPAAALFLAIPAAPLSAQAGGNGTRMNAERAARLYVSNDPADHSTGVDGLAGRGASVSERLETG